jgi:hypothetical protein
MENAPAEARTACSSLGGRRRRLPPASRSHLPARKKSQVPSRIWMTARRRQVGGVSSAVYQFLIERPGWLLRQRNRRS